MENSVIAITIGIAIDVAAIIISSIVIIIITIPDINQITALNAGITTIITPQTTAQQA